MKVWIELFRVSFEGPEVCYKTTRIDATARGCDPDDLVAEHLRSSGLLPQERAFVHSTSWRYEGPANLVLTYLALGEGPPELAPGTRRADLRAIALPPSADACRPRPAEIREEHVLAHGLRHLALLEQQRSAVAAASASFAQALAGYDPGPAGRLG